VGKILIVDDETTYSYALCEILRADGFETDWASGAKQALESLQHSTPDLLLVDIVLPDMNGLALIRLIREQTELAQIPIIVISARTMQDDRTQSILAGANAFLSKPFSRDQLHEAIYPFFPAMIPSPSIS
jgi:DNA-binding response OmpR family regulator